MLFVIVLNSKCEPLRKQSRLDDCQKNYSVFNKNYYDYTCVDHSAAFFYFIFTLNIHSDTLVPEAFFYSFLANKKKKNRFFYFYFLLAQSAESRSAICVVNFQIKKKIIKESFWDQGNILKDFVLTHFPTLHLGGGKFLRPYFLTVVQLEAKLLGLLSHHSPHVGLHKICFQLIHQTSSLRTYL